MKKDKKIMTDADYSGLTLLKKNHKDYPDSPEKAKIETFRNAFPKRDYIITFDCPEFTSLCPITGQPDFGHITINYIAKEKCIESKALKLYLFSYRNHNTFHEVAVNTILDDLVAAESQSMSPQNTEKKIKSLIVFSGLTEYILSGISLREHFCFRNRILQ